MNYEMVDIIDRIVAKDLSSCLDLAEAYTERVKNVPVEKRAPFPYSFYGYDSRGNQALFFEGNGALEFLESLLALRSK